MQRALVPQATSSVYVANLPPGTDETLLAEHFGQIGVIKKDKRHGRLKIWLYRDKASNEPKGDATVTYEDPHAAAAAVEWFDNKDFHGATIRVSIAEPRARDATEQQQAPPLALAEPMAQAAPEAVDDYGEPSSETAAVDGGRGRGRGDAKCWQQEGDWPCPNPSCGNINFAFRGSCNRCGASRPSSGSGGGGGGRGRGRGTDAAGRGGRSSIFGPNDWSCPMCGNTNWAKRTKCNICNTTKPGHTEGGVREGRAGGYKEFDEAEIEETKRRRKELEEDDGEMYDEFGNLKKKFRLKSKQGEGPGLCVGWDKEDLGYVDNLNKSKASHGKDEHNGSRSNDTQRYKERERERRDSNRDSNRDQWMKERRGK